MMDFKVVDAKGNAKAAEVDEFDVLQEETEYAFVYNSTPSDDDNEVICDLQDIDHVFNQNDQGSIVPLEIPLYN